MNVCTIVAKNYIAHARVLAASFFEHHPDGRFTVLIIDDVEGYLDPAAEPFDVLGPHDIGLPDFEAMATRYDVLELSTAVKPWLLRTLLAHDDHVVYLDPDIQVFRSLEPLAEAARRHGLVLTPHDLGPMPRDGRKPSEQDILIAGTYNLGFVAMGDNEATQGVLDWWSERLLTDCIVDPEKGFFVDQRWMDLVVGTVPDFTLIREAAYNVAYWNLHNRELSRTADGEVLVNDEPLRFFHFSGYDPRKPHLLSKHQNRIRLEDSVVLRELADGYGRALLEAGFEGVISWPYEFNITPSGIGLDRALRRAWASAVDSGQLSESLFTRAGEEAFIAWLAEPAPQGGGRGVNRFMWMHWQARPDLQRAFPVLDRDGGGLIEWFQIHGGEQHLSVPAGLVPAAVEGPPAPPRIHEPASLGVNVAGYLNSEHGVGEVARQAISALDAVEVPVYPAGLVATASRQGHVYDVEDLKNVPYQLSLLCVNADQTPSFAYEVGGEFFAGRHTIGWWWWEIGAFPEEWLDAFTHVDELWAGSRFIADNLAEISPVPVHHIPMPVTLPDGIHPDRRRLGFTDRFAFYFAFDHNSVFERKNPIGAIEAFTRAFPVDERGGPMLVIRSINADRFPDEHQRLIEAAGDRRDIVVIDRYLSVDDKNRMLASCDSFVSLHRAEGFGINAAEAMLLGKPVIGTQWSGSSDYMHEAHSYPVGHTMVRVGPGNAPYPPDGEWAEPDLDEAARHMRAVFEDQDEAARRGEAARDFVQAEHNAHAAGEAMLERITEILNTELLTGSTLPAPPAVGLDGVRSVALKGPRRSGRAKFDPRRAARAAALRVVSPHRRHQQEVDTQIIGAVEYLAGSVRDYAEDLGRTLRGDAYREAARSRAEALALKRNYDRQLSGLERRIEDLMAGHGRLERMLAKGGGTNGAAPAITPRRPPQRGPLEALGERHPPTDVPWTEEYAERHTAFVADALVATDLTERFGPGCELPDGYGRGFDERVVEFPWLVANAPRGRTLDAGSVLNHPHILDRVLPELSALDIVTLAPERHSYPERGISYVYADLRELPYRDEQFDTVVCMSTVEHIGMVNEMYGSNVPREADPDRERHRALIEMSRVLAPGGHLFLTIPYGVHEDLEWMEQHDRAQVEALIDATPLDAEDVAVYGYDAEGWRRSTLDAEADKRYRDYLGDPRPVDDQAVAARAVVCIRFTKPERA